MCPSEHCHIGVKRHARKPDYAPICSGEVRGCQLCNEWFCAAHKSTGPWADANVCEINHKTYYNNHRDKAGVYPSLDGRAAAQRLDLPSPEETARRVWGEPAGVSVWPVGGRTVGEK